MELTAVFAKTPKGVSEIKTRSATLTPTMRRMLILADGKRSLADLVPLVQPHDVETLASALWEQGMIASTDGGEAFTSVNTETEIQAPATVNAEPTSAQRPAVLHLTLPAPDRLVERPGAGPPTLHDTIEFVKPLARELSFAVAGTLRPSIPADAIDSAARTTASTAAAQHTATLLRSLSIDEPELHDQSEFGPHRTDNRVTNAALIVAINGAGNSATAGARSVARATVDGNATRAAGEIASAAIRQHAAPAINGSSAAASEDTLLEESKRVAVRALFERLGPYGEEPAAKIQECTSLAALHEQVQKAVGRIAMFRGERAAQEYLLMLAQP